MLSKAHVARLRSNVPAEKRNFLRLGRINIQIDSHPAVWDIAPIELFMLDIHPW
jgi:hypothetical protein